MLKPHCIFGGSSRTTHFFQSKFCLDEYFCFLSCMGYGRFVHTSARLINSLIYRSWFLLHCRCSHATFHKIMSFLVNPNFMPTDIHSFTICCMIQNDISIIIFFPCHLFCNSHFFLALHQLQRLSQFQHFLVSFHGVVIAMDAMPTYLTFYFYDSCLPLSLCGGWAGSLCYIHITFKDYRWLPQ